MVLNKMNSLLLSVLLVLFPTGRQVTSQTTGDCLAADETGQVIIVEDCVCDPSCDICGFYGETVSGPDDCFTCPDGFVLTEVFDDGSGTCTEDLGTLDPTNTLDPTSTLDPTGTTTLDLAPTSPPVNETDGTVSTSGGICFMVYQMADNDLEYFIRDDLSEMTKSAFVASTDTTTWVYFDALNEGHVDYTGGALADVYNADGTPLTEPFGGSRYLKWDHDLGKMVVDTIFPTELNSDSPLVVQAFLEYGLTDCVAKGKTEFVFVLSSHGGGYAGFGWDDHERRHSRRLGYQSNADINSAIQAALMAVSGAPSQLDVLGFDACLMQSMGALDDFVGISKYYLASEATEPGHGWAYNELSATTSAVDLGVEIVDTFVMSLQGYADHLTPKTLALVDTAAFLTFRDAWEAMCASMAAILSNGTDGDFHAYLHRARGNTISFEGSLDSGPLQVNAAMDIGDFIVKFFQLCVPDESSELYILMNTAYQAYNAMFVISKVGPLTLSATGMHISWVSKQEYLIDPEYYESELSPSGTDLVTGVPNYWSFLDLFYSTPTPAANAGVSVCGSSASASRASTSLDELLIDPTLIFVDAITSEIRSEITRNVDFVLVEYGIDVSSWLEDEGFRRRLDESAHRQRARRLGKSSTKGANEAALFTRRRRTMKWRYRDANNRRRIQQNAADPVTEDFFYLFGGDVLVQYNGSSVAALWDSTFFWIESGDDIEPIYAFDNGEGLKSIPVCYFDENHPVTSEQIAIGITVDDAIADVGCQLGFLSFSIAEGSNGQITLYVYKEDTLSEEPVKTGRNIVQISYIEYSVGDDFVDELLGGFGSVVIPWTPESNVSVYVLRDADNLEILGSDTAFMEIFAYDEDTNITDLDFFPYSYVDPEEPPSLADLEDLLTSAPSSAVKVPFQVAGACVTILVSTFVFG